MSDTKLVITDKTPDIRDLYFARIQRNKDRAANAIMGLVAVISIILAVILTHKI